MTCFSGYRGPSLRMDCTNNQDLHAPQMGRHRRDCVISAVRSITISRAKFVHSAKHATFPETFARGVPSSLVPFFSCLFVLLLARLFSISESSTCFILYSHLV